MTTIKRDFSDFDNITVREFGSQDIRLTAIDSRFHDQNIPPFMMKKSGCPYKTPRSSTPAL